jgi:hypothetical protein
MEHTERASLLNERESLEGRKVAPPWLVQPRQYASWLNDCRVLTTGASDES